MLMREALQRGIDAMDWRRTLAANLAVAGALCAVWQRAFNDGWECADFRRAVDWAPGCGRAWGGGA